jgi:hypothetical protein
MTFTTGRFADESISTEGSRWDSNLPRLNPNGSFCFLSSVRPVVTAALIYALELTLDIHIQREEVQ